MIDVQTELDRRGVARIVKEVRPRLIESQRHQLVTGTWGWEELRDYVVSEIHNRFGAFPRDAIKEASIFRRFVKEWGDQAEPIARFAFDTLNGMWEGEPVSIYRFCRGSDPFFAVPITRRLADYY